MTRTHWLVRLFIGFAMLAVMQATALVARAQGNRDLAEISAYRLTESGLAKYSKAVKELGPLAASASGSCRERDDDSDDGAQSIDAAAAKLEAIPGVAAAFDSAGISAREFVVFTFSLFQTGMASWALEQPGGTLPAGVPMDNVNFYRAHASAMEQLGQQTRANECGDGQDEGDVAEADAG